MGIHLRKLEHTYMRAERVKRGPPGITAPWLLNNTYCCYDRESSINNDNEKKHYLQHKEKHINIEENLHRGGLSHQP